MYTAVRHCNTHSISFGTLISCRCICGQVSKREPLKIDQGDDNLPSFSLLEFPFHCLACYDSKSINRRLCIVSHLQSIHNTILGSQFLNICTRDACGLPAAPSPFETILFLPCFLHLQTEFFHREGCRKDLA